MTQLPPNFNVSCNIWFINNKYFFTSLSFWEREKLFILLLPLYLLQILKKRGTIIKGLLVKKSLIWLNIKIESYKNGQEIS
jgi:hypothetical protein